MVSRLRPLDVNLVFEDRPYKVGEAIKLTVELTPRGDVEVREGLLELICEESWMEVYTVMVPVPGGGMNRSPEGASIAGPSPMVSRQTSKDFKETYVHDAVIFLQDMHLRSDYTSKYEISLEIQSEPVPRVGAKVKWSLVTVIDVAQARDIKTRRTVNVALA